MNRLGSLASRGDLSGMLKMPNTRKTDARPTLQGNYFVACERRRARNSADVTG